LRVRLWGVLTEGESANLPKLLDAIARDEVDFLFFDSNGQSLN
jgi:hypothetical protein